jgi:hypothetical protein
LGRRSARVSAEDFGDPGANGWKAEIFSLARTVDLQLLYDVGYTANRRPRSHEPDELKDSLLSN